MIEPIIDSSGLNHFVKPRGGYPGLRLFVLNNDDPGWHHERLVLWFGADQRVVVVTLDGVFTLKTSMTITLAKLTGCTQYPSSVTDSATLWNKRHCNSHHSGLLASWSHFAVGGTCPSKNTNNLLGLGGKPAESSTAQCHACWSGDNR